MLLCRSGAVKHRIACTLGPRLSPSTEALGRVDGEGGGGEARLRHAAKHSGGMNYHTANATTATSESDPVILAEPAVGELQVLASFQC